MASTDNFAIFILTNNRPNKVITLNTLKRSGYTGKVYLVLDDEDTSIEQYRELHGRDNILVFSKKEAARYTDVGDGQPNLRGVVYARNASQKLAQELGYDYILQLDDDYTGFSYRYLEDGRIRSQTVRNFDEIVTAMLDFLDKTNALTVAFSQGGDHFGGVDGPITKGLLRKAMNSFFIRTTRPVNFLGRINEDTNAYVLDGTRGELFFTVMGIQLNQVQTQKSSGGLTEIYLDSGTYVKSFYTVMMAPSCTKIKPMGKTHMRLHHSVSWDNAVPKIISQNYKKRQ